MKLQLFAVIFSVFFLSLLACNDDPFDAIGAACEIDRHCPAGGVCLRGGDYPGGFCSFPCSHTSECPRDAACIDTRGGVCLFQCLNDRDCASGYECKNKSFRGSAGKVRVCIGD